MINEGIAIIRLEEVNNNLGKIPMKDNISNRTDRWFKTRSISTGYNRVNISDGPFQSGGTDIMVEDEVSCRVIATGHEFRNLIWWSWMLL